MLLLASCGKQHQAENLVEDFVEAYAQKEIDIRSFSDLDSTRVIADSVILALRSNAERDPLFGKALLAPFEQHSEHSSLYACAIRSLATLSRLRAHSISTTA